MTLADNMLNRLESTLSRAIAGLEQLTGLMGEERAALADKDPAVLESVVARKVKALGSIEPDLNALDDLLGELRLTVPDQATLDRLAGRPETSDLARLWRQLQELAVEIERQNLVNGQLAQQRERSARAALSILTGRDNDDQTYGAHGASQGKLGGYSLAKA